MQRHPIEPGGPGLDARQRDQCDVAIDLYADICPQAGQCGSGHGPFAIEIPLSGIRTTGGEPIIPEPGGAIVLAIGAAVAGAVSRCPRAR
jgi:hypothetical protein